jgi:hypothetical protein
MTDNDGELHLNEHHLPIGGPPIIMRPPPPPGGPSGLSRRMSFILLPPLKMLKRYMKWNMK